MVRRLIWTCWIILAAVAAAGLPRYRVNNSMDAWMPDLVTVWRYPSYLVVGVADPGIDMARLSSRLRALPAVAVCVDPLSVTAAQFLTGVTPEDFVVGKEGSYRGVFCFRSQASTDRELLEQVESAITSIAPRSDFAIGGPAAFHVAMDQWSQQRIGVIVCAILICGGAMLYSITASARIAVVAMLAISFSQIIFLGTICWLNIPMDMALALVPPMMTGMGFSYAAHRALRRQSFGVLIVCVIAAAVGIASFATADLLPVRHFALAGVPGLLLVWLTTMTLVQPDYVARRRRIAWLRTPRRLCIALITHFRRPLVVIATVITLASICMAPVLHIETDPLRFFPPDSPIARDFATLDHRLTGMLPSHVIVNGGSGDPRPILRATPGMRKVVDVSPWTTASGRTYLCLADDDAVDSLAAHLPAWQSRAREQGMTVQWHGVAPQIYRSARSIRQIAAESLPSMIIMIAALVALLFRRMRAALIAAWVCLLPVSALTITAAVAGLRLGPVTLMIGSITAGVAVDDMLHLLTSARRHRSLRRATIECWKPCVGSSLAAALCFSLFTLSAFGPTRQFGLLMALATCFAMLANQLILPAALRASSVPSRHSRTFRATAADRTICGS